MVVQAALMGSQGTSLHEGCLVSSSVYTALAPEWDF